jgi:hypothetical protein
MPTVFVARSRTLQNWASDVGLTLNVFKLGVAEDDAEAAVSTLNATSHAGRADWELIAEQNMEDIDETSAIARAARKEALVDPVYYPQIKKAPGIFKVKPANVENHFMVREALNGQQIKRVKLTAERIGEYLIRMATG